MLAPIVSKKHIVQTSLSTTSTGSRATVNVVNTVAVPTSAAVDVAEGSVIKAIYIDMWITSDDTAQGSGQVIVYKLPAGATAATYGEITALNPYVNKRNIFHTFMGLVGPTIQPPMNGVGGWIKIPKGKQRMALGDKINIGIAGQSNGMNFCGFTLYKEYQ